MITKAIHGADLKALRDIFKEKYGTMKNAAEKMGINVFTFSRIINGSATADLHDTVKILIGAGYLPKAQYKIPRIDIETFFILNNIMKIDAKKGTTETLRNGRKVITKHK